MRTLAARQRSGIASMMLEHIITEARRMGFTRLSLETGSAEFFAPARRLYQKFGFEYCEPFASYRPDPPSVFLDRKSTRLNSSHPSISYAVFCLKKKTKTT